MKIIPFIDACIKKKKIRFFIVGGINTLATYALFALHLYVNIHYLVANIVVYIAGILLGYIGNKLFTFKTKEKSKREFLRYSMVSIVCFLISNFNLYCLIDLLKVNKYFSGAISTIIIVVISWIGHSRFSFRKIPISTFIF